MGCHPALQLTPPRQLPALPVCVPSVPLLLHHPKPWPIRLGLFFRHRGEPHDPRSSHARRGRQLDPAAHHRPPPARLPPPTDGLSAPHSGALRVPSCVGQASAGAGPAVSRGVCWLLRGSVASDLRINEKPPLVNGTRSERVLRVSVGLRGFRGLRGALRASARFKNAAKMRQVV